MKVFVSCADSYVGRALTAALTQWKAGGDVELEILGSVKARREDGNTKQATTGTPSAVNLALTADIIFINLMGALVEAEAITEALRARLSSVAAARSPRGEGADVDANAQEDGEDAAASPGMEKTLVAMSSTLTWDRTTSIPQPFEETLYKRRRPGMKGAAVRDAEAHVLSLARPDRGMRCHVVAGGLPYGEGEGPLFQLFRRAWLNVDAYSTDTDANGGLPVPCIRAADGSNVLPMVHVADFANFAVRIAQASSDLQQDVGQGEYFVAVDEGKDSLTAVCAAISRAIGNGGTRTLTKEQAIDFFRDPDASLPAQAAAAGATASEAGATSTMGEASSTPTQEHLGYDGSLVASAQVYTSAAASFDTDGASIFADGRVALSDDVWRARAGFIASIDAVAAEFVKARDLRPSRIVVTGPPAVGKTRTAALLARKYHLPIVDVKGAISSVRGAHLRHLSDGSEERKLALAALRDAVDKFYTDAEAAAAAAAAADKGKSKGAASAGAAKKGQPAAAADTSELYDRGIRLPRRLLVRVLRALLLSPEVRNRGYVLDGFPRTWADAEALFTALPEGDDGITPQDGDSDAVPREEAEDDEVTLAEAQRKGVSIVVLGQNATAQAGNRAPGDEDESAPAAEDVDLRTRAELDPRIAPTAVLNLEAPDEFLESRILALPAATVAGTHNTRDAFVRRLRRYRIHGHTSLSRTPISWLEVHARAEVCEVDVARLNQRAASESTSFDEDGEDAIVATAVSVRYSTGPAPQWVVPSDIPVGPQRVGAVVDVEILRAAAPYVHRGGRPYNFHPTPAEQAMLHELLAHRREAKATSAAAAAASAHAEEQSLRSVYAEKEAEHAAYARRAESALLEARTAPLRSYLVKNVIPHVTAGLVEVCKRSPVDPVDFLAEYLLKTAEQLEAKQGK